MAIIHDSTTLNLNYSVADIVMLTGNASNLSFDDCHGDSAMVMGTNDDVGTGKDTTNSAIYDFGQGTEFSFYELGSHAMTFADLKVYSFQNDPTGFVNILGPVWGQSSDTITSDGQGGSFLTIPGPTGGTVHFVYDDPTNLAAHIKIA